MVAEPLERRDVHVEELVGEAGGVEIQQDELAGQKEELVQPSCG